MRRAGFIKAAHLLIALSLAAINSHAATVPGRTPGNFDVSAEGAATYSVPLWTPPGPHGMQPNLALTYNSLGGNGELGIGWGLAGLSSIERCYRTIAQDGAGGAITRTNSDVFCLDGRRLRLTGGTYGAAGSTYGTEIEDYSV